jgi:hypothetical protein
MVQIENLNCDLYLSTVTNITLRHEVFQKEWVIVQTTLVDLLKSAKFI